MRDVRRNPTPFTARSPRPGKSPVFLIFIIITIPILFGAVQTVVWSVYAGMLFLAFLAALWRDDLPPGWARSPLLMFSPGLFFVYTLLQVMPLPGGILRHVSPFQHQVCRDASAIMGSGFLPHSLSYVGSASFSWWIFLLGLMAFFLLLQRRLGDTGNLTRVVGAMMAVALFEGLYGLIQALIPTLPVLWADVPAGLGNARGTFINKNHFAGFVEMVWPLGLGVILALAHRWQENMDGGYSRKKLKNLLSSDRIGLLLFLGIALLFTLLALLFSKSRAGIIGAFVGFAAFIFLSHLGGKKFSTPAWVFMGLGACFILFYGNVIGFEELIGRFLATDDETGSRVDIWRNTIAVIKDHPLGIGLKNYEIVLPIYDATSPPGIKFTHAHNDYLELLVETGWPGFIIIMAGFIIFLGKCFQRIRRAGAKTDPMQFYIGIGACSGIISIIFHGFFDFNLQIPSNLLYFVVLMALADAALKKT